MTHPGEASSEEIFISPTVLMAVSIFRRRMREYCTVLFSIMYQSYASIKEQKNRKDARTESVRQYLIGRSGEEDGKNI